MARDEMPLPGATAAPREALQNPHIRLLGEINAGMVAVLRDRIAELPDADPLVIEICTPGGDAEMGRLLAQELRELRAKGRRVVFLGKTMVYSAGVTMMAAVPPEDRYLTADAMLLIHCRRMDEQVHLQGPLKSCVVQARTELSKIEAGIRLEREGFEELIAGSDVSFEEVDEKAQHNWYVPAEEALQRRLVAGLL